MGITGLVRLDPLPPPPELPPPPLEPPPPVPVVVVGGDVVVVGGVVVVVGGDVVVVGGDVVVVGLVVVVVVGVEAAKVSLIVVAQVTELPPPVALPLHWLMVTRSAVAPPVTVQSTAGFPA